MNRVPEVDRGRAKRLTIRKIQKLLRNHGVKDWKDSFKHATVLQELNNQANFELGWTNPRKGNSVLIKFSNNSEVSQLVWVRLSHSLLGSSMREARNAFFEMTTVRNSVGLVYEVINKTEFYNLSARAKVACIISANARHEHMSRGAGSNRWNDAEAKIFINHVASLVNNSERYFQENSPDCPWRNLSFWKAGTNRLLGGKVNGGIIGAISRLCMLRWIGTDEEKSAQNSVEPYDIVVAVVSDMEKLRPLLVAAVRNTSVKDDMDNFSSGDEESPMGSSLEDHGVIQEVILDSGGALDLLMKRSPRGEQGSSVKGDVTTNRVTGGMPPKTGTDFESPRVRNARNTNYGVFSPTASAAETPEGTNPDTTKASSHPSRSNVCQRLASGHMPTSCLTLARNPSTTDDHLTVSDTLQSSLRNSDGNPSPTDSAAFPEDARIVSQSIIAPRKTLAVKRSRRQRDSGGALDVAGDDNYHQNNKRLSSRKAKNQSSTPRRHITIKEDAPNRFKSHRDYENAVCEDFGEEETVQEISVSTSEGRDIPLTGDLPCAIRKESRQFYYVDSSCMFRIVQDILFSSAMSNSSLVPPMVGVTLDKATYASTSYFKMKKMELSLRGYFVDPEVFTCAFPGEMESSSIAICVKNIMDFMEEKLAKFAHDKSKSWWHSILNTLDAPPENGENLKKTSSGGNGRNSRWQTIDTHICDDLERINSDLFKDKCMIEVYLAKYIERLGIQDPTAPLTVPLRGFKLLASTNEAAPQIPHTDFNAPQPGWSSARDSRGNMERAFGESPELINMKLMFSGEQPFVIRIWPMSHIANSTADVNTRHDFISCIPSRLVVVPPMSILALRGDVGHAAAGGQEMHFGVNGYPLTEKVFEKHEHLLFNRTLPSGEKVNIRGHMYMPRAGGRIHNALFSLRRSFDNNFASFPFKCNDANMPLGHVPDESGY